MAKPYPKNKIVGTLKDSFAYIGDTDYWIMRNGHVVAVKDLRKTHIENIMLLMVRDMWRQEYIPVMQQELRRRKEMKLIKKGKAGKILYAKT